MSTDSTRLTLGDYLIPLKQRWWLAVALAVIVTALVYVYEKHRPDLYTAGTEVYLTNTGTATGSVATNPTAVSDQATLLLTTEVAAVVAKKIGYPGSPAALAGSVSAAPTSSGDFLRLSTTQSTAAEAVLVVNAYAKEFIARNGSALVTANNGQIASLRRQITALKAEASSANKAQIASDQQEIATLQLQNDAARASATQINPATGASLIAHKTTEYAALSGIVALIGGILIVYMLYRLDPKLKRVGDASDIYAHPVLTTVINDRHILYFEDGRPGLSPKSREAFRDLRVALNLVSPGERFSKVIVTSASPGEGKSTVSRNFSLALAEAGLRVAVIDADLRRRSLAGLFGAQSTPGLTEVLAGVATLEQVKREIPIQVQVVPGLEQMAARLGRRAEELDPVRRASVTLIPAGTTPPNPSAVLESLPFRELLAELAATYDVVVLDTTPITAVSDAMPLMGEVDAIMLVARSGATDRRTAQRASELIERVPGSNIVGVVVNGVPAAEAVAYGSGYGYGYDPRPNGRAAKRREPEPIKPGIQLRQPDA